MPEPSDDGDEREEFRDLYADDMDSDARLGAVIERVKEFIFDKPLPPPMVDMLKEKMGVNVRDMTVTDREINMIEAVCRDGHIHREILLIETFGKAADPQPPEMTVDIAMDRLKSLASSVPVTGLGRHQEDQFKTVMGMGEDGSIKRAFNVSQVFETEASVIGYKPGSPPPFVRAMIAQQRAKGINGPGTPGLP